jgi:hypothetical protein
VASARALELIDIRRHLAAASRTAQHARFETFASSTAAGSAPVSLRPRPRLPLLPSPEAFGDLVRAVFDYRSAAVASEAAGAAAESSASAACLAKFEPFRAALLAAAALRCA